MGNIGPIVIQRCEFNRVIRCLALGDTHKNSVGFSNPLTCSSPIGLLLVNEHVKSGLHRIDRPNALFSVSSCVLRKIEESQDTNPRLLADPATSSSSPSSLSQAHPPPLTLNTFTHHTIQFPGASAAFYRFTIHPNRYHEATQRVVDIKLFECYMLRVCFLGKNFLLTSMYKAHYPKAKKNISEGKLSSFLQTFGWYTNNIQGHLPRIIQIDFLTLAQHSPTFTPIAVTQKPHKVTHYPGGPHRIIQLTLCSGRAWHTADRHGSRSLYTNTLNSFKTNTPPKNVIEFTSSNSTHSTLYIPFIPFTTGVHRRTHSARIR